MSTFVLMLGIAAIAAPLGFMVGGSASPVVGIILPAILGLVATAVGLYQIKFPSKDQLEIFTELQQNELLPTRFFSPIAVCRWPAIWANLSLFFFGLAVCSSIGSAVFYFWQPRGSR